MRDFGKTLFIVGLLLSGIGALLWRFGDWSFWRKIGHLPGDFAWQKGGSTFSLPLTTCLLLSLLLSLLSWLIRR